VDVIVVAVVHWLHVMFALYWFGTILFTRLVLFPSLARIPEHEAAVRRALVEGPARRLTIIASIGTVGLGILRGAMSGALSDLTSAYGLTYLAALIIGLAMLSYITIGFPKGPLWGKLYVAGFPVMFTLMVAMRFGY
jgi:uncharacterized membrane protein